MRAKVLAFCRENRLFDSGDRVICAVSGGKDSMALLWCLWELRQKLGITVTAAHFNHHLRGAESDRDEAFVREFCQGFGIPCAFGGGEIRPGEKGLEAACREARYGFLLDLDETAKIATAHTADDNGETILLHLLRGTGLNGLCGIPPQRGRIVRPLLSVTAAEVAAYLDALGLPHVEDSTNGDDDFLRNRLRHQVMPILLRENPAFAANLTPTAQRLRLDRDYLEEEGQRAYEWAQASEGLDCRILKTLHPAIRSRVLARFLQENGLQEPNSRHILEAEKLAFSDRPSAGHGFPGGLTLRRQYDFLTAGGEQSAFSPVTLVVPGVTEVSDLGLRFHCELVVAPENPKSSPTSFLLDLAALSGPLVLRPRKTGDELRLTAGAKSLKKIMIDRKIPAKERGRIPVLADDGGILGAFTLGPDVRRLSRPGEPALRITMKK